jgi:hypothetical protein
MTLTVRLDSTLEGALERYCTERGVTKTLVVQECLASYLLAARSPSTDNTSKDAKPVSVSANYKAFAEAGLIGCIAGVGGVGGADKAAVRARVAEVFAQRKARQGAG